LGSGGSILIAGVTAQYLDWHWAFAFAGIGGLIALVIVAFVLPSRPPTLTADDIDFVLDFRPVLRDRAVMSYIVASLGTAWEVFSARVWLVTFFVFLQARSSAEEADFSPAVWATAVAFIGVPAAMIIGEFCVRYDRRRVVMGIAFLSAIFAGAIGLSLDGAYEITIIFCLIFGISSYGRSATINAGMIAAADPSRRGIALAALAFIGFSGGILGPLAFGIALDQFGSVNEPVAWKFAMAIMALGGLVSFLSIFLSPKREKVS